MPLLNRFVLPWLMFRCADHVKQELRSGNAKYIAKVFERNCGATTDYNTYVSLRSGRPWFIGGKNQEVLNLDGQCAIGLTWIKDTLQVAYPQSCEVFHRLESWSGVHIQFKTGPPW